jgi:hypothetical protein
MKTSGNLSKVTIQNWQGRDKISYNLNGAWYGVYLDKLEPDMVSYVKGFHEGDEAEIEYEVKEKSGGGTYNAMIGIVPVTRPEGAPRPAPVQPAGQLLKPKWQGGGKRVEEDPDKKIRSMTVSYSHDFEIARNEGQPTPWRVDYDEVIRGARILEKYIKEG